MKKILIIVLTGILIKAHSQKKPVHISMVQGVSTQGKESKNYDYNFSFNLLSGTVQSIKGLEVGSIYNQNQGDMLGLQWSGVINITKGNVRGFQTAGVVNIASKVTGIQNAGVANHAQDVNGIQISGVYNKAKTLRGFQIGVLNLADSVEKGGGIGLLNFYKKGGYQEVEISAADYQNIAINFKTGTKILYTIISAGYNFNPQSLFVTGIGFGSKVQVKNDWYFKPELVWYNYYKDDFKFKNRTNTAHLRFGLMKKLNNVAISLYPSIYYAEIPKIVDGELTQISAIKPLTENEKGKWGLGIGLGVGFLK